MSESDTDSHSYPASDSSKFECVYFSFVSRDGNLATLFSVRSRSRSDCDDEVSYSIESMTGWILAGHTRSSRCLVSIIGKVEETPILIIDCSGHFQQVVE